MNVHVHVNANRCVYVYVYVCLNTFTHALKQKKKHTWKSAPASSQSGVIPVTHKGPFLCHSLADPGRMCVEAVPWPTSMERFFSGVFSLTGLHQKNTNMTIEVTVPMFAAECTGLQVCTYMLYVHWNTDMCMYVSHYVCR